MSTALGKKTTPSAKAPSRHGRGGIADARTFVHDPEFDLRIFFVCRERARNKERYRKRAGTMSCRTVRDCRRQGLTCDRCGSALVCLDGGACTLPPRSRPSREARLLLATIALAGCVALFPRVTRRDGRRSPPRRGSGAAST